MTSVLQYTLDVTICDGKNEDFLIILDPNGNGGDHKHCVKLSSEVSMEAEASSLRTVAVRGLPPEAQWFYFNTLAQAGELGPVRLMV